MKTWTNLLFIAGFITTPIALAAVSGQSELATPTPKDVVRQFLNDVRSGKSPDQASNYLASEVLAHQVNSEDETTIVRNPADYTAHVKDFRRIYGDFHFEITELLAEGDRVYARWKQSGCHTGSADGIAPSGLPVIEIASAVYRVQDGKIVEYWIQIDRKGIESQVATNARSTGNKIRCAH